MGASDLGALAGRIGVEKLLLIQWVCSDITFARLVTTNITQSV